MLQRELGAKKITLPSLAQKHNFVIIQILIKWRQEVKGGKAEVNIAIIL